MRLDRNIFHDAVTALRRNLLTILLISATAFPAVAQDTLNDAFDRLAQSEGEGWRNAESDILREWSRSGSPAMDVLLQRGEAALDMGDIPAAVGHLTALTDHAPDFAAGFHARAAAYAAAGQFGPALADLARTLQLEPRHFAALTQLGVMLEEMGQDDRALAAYRESLKIHPHQQEAIDGAARLERKRLGTDI
ncbi:tetratricopeptide repeat protein [Paracoccus beibuensis]|uniref:tetratricopeptide repeat protein n=1 Tax=Paracoccus beibuensis TaxID=547602 RepID=UPI00223FC6C1|nr:tetratricopeptide repeat protein [Paracoccus beibuensis]